MQTSNDEELAWYTIQSKTVSQVRLVAETEELSQLLSVRAQSLAVYH